MSDFWDSLSTLGTETIQRVSAPVSSALGRTFTNIVQGAQLKVSAVTDKIVKSTDPMKNANSPAIPPTTGSTAHFPPLTFAGVQVSLIFAAALVVLVVYYMSKKGS